MARAFTGAAAQRKARQFANTTTLCGLFLQHPLVGIATAPVGVDYKSYPRQLIE